MRKILGPLLLAVLALISLLLLQHQKDRDPSAAPATPNPTAVSRPPAAARPSPSLASPSPERGSSSGPAPSLGSPGEVDGDPVPATASVTPASPDQGTQWAAATELASRFLKAFARPAPGTPAAAWWSTVQPYLTTQAAADYAGTDPANVPFTTVTGPGVIVPVDAHDSVITAVMVPTDAGTYLVEIRSTPDGPRVARATPQASR